MTVRANQVLALAAPVTIWAIHFTIVYALISAACSPRELIGVPALQVTVFIVTIVALIGAGLPLIRVPSRHRGDEMVTAIRLCAALSVVAIFINALTFPFFGSCGG